MKVYFVRHGQSEGNISDRHNAWAQVPLTEQGKKDAAMAGRLLKGISFDKVYTSDLIRAIQTKEIAMPDAEYEVLPILREVNVGNLLGRRIVDCEAEYGPSYMENRYLTNFAPYGGEDRAALQQRIREFLTMLEQAPYETVAVFGHGTYIMNLLDVITGVHHNKRQICCDNGSVTVIEFDGGLWHLRAWNCREFA